MSVIEAAKKYNALIYKSIRNLDLKMEAQAHSNYQARQCQQGHQNWDLRCKRLMNIFPGYTFSEICAESWPWQENNSEYKLWCEMFQCWQQSPGHWDVASRKHTIWGYGIAKSKNIWYACIIVGDVV